jgi:anti-anti-sigma factor
MLSIQTRQVQPDIVVVEASGRVTMGNDCKQLEWATDNLVRDNQKKVIFDLTGVSHIDSTGIGIIVMAAGQMKKAGGALRVAGANPHVEQLLKLTQVDQIVGLHSTVVSAVTGF